MTGIAVAVLGARGFIGSAVVAAAQADPRVSTVRPVYRSGSDSGPDVVTADVRDRDRLRSALDGVDVVVNAAHVIGSGPDLAVNEVGPGLVAETAHAGGARCLEIGTAAVYGRGPLRGGAEGDLTLHPDSALSASRAAGEARALDAGAVVLRPMIVVGRGDRWAVPAAAAAAAADPREPTARVSAIDVDELARLVVSVALAPDLPPVLHAARPRPTLLADLLGAAGYRTPPGAGVEAHVRAMLHTDRWVDADLAWALAGWEPEGPLVGAASRRWYGSPAG
ncbi:NAD(P)-dependent oxidoreductase [uncultured Phycicoccus sp.]|uniref:NAD-dependent epimerase/dehydratase family protein n=1 Tax=uncultured Phycicoccus sp. TaxID=661422 RepID=UPI0026087649|nr:NAD(P)-dependent oxidoreductase [uncultured Phycicoccus sp.]